MHRRVCVCMVEIPERGDVPDDSELWFDEYYFPSFQNPENLGMFDTDAETVSVDEAVVSEAETVLNETDDSRTRYVVTELLETCNYTVSQETVYTVTENTDEDE